MSPSNKNCRYGNRVALHAGTRRKFGNSLWLLAIAGFFLALPLGGAARADSGVVLVDSDTLHLDSDYSNYHGLVFAPSSSAFWLDLADTGRYTERIDTARHAALAGSLMIAAAGDEGHEGPRAAAGLPTLLEQVGQDNSAFVHNWLSISAVDERFNPADPRFISAFTNLGQGASTYTLLAPGTGSNGSSMAAVYASGVAALVQQTFPYMDGKQTADVLLSTATAMDAPGLVPRFIILRKQDYDVTKVVDGADTDYVPSDTLLDQKLIVHTYTGSSFSGTLTTEERAYFLQQLNCTEAELDAALAAVNEYTDFDDYAALFGQGVINAANAVLGPGYLDANRLDQDTDLSTGGEFGSANYAMYGVDTKGFDSTWSHGIGQRQGDDPLNALYSLNVGLRKQGGGMLYLTGANTYRGPTAVEGGGLSLGKAGYSGASVYGSVFVKADGLFTGDGTVGYDPVADAPVPSSLVSEGLLMPGQESAPGSTLTVGGDAIGTGSLRLVLGQNGLGNSLDAQNIVMSGALEVTGGTGAPIRPYTDYANVLNALNTLDVTGLQASVTVSPFLSFSTVQTGQSMSLIATTNALNSLPGVAGRTQDTAGALEHMYHHLDGDPLQREMDFLYNLDRGTFLDTTAAMRGDVQAATLTRLPLQGQLASLVRGRGVGSVSASGPVTDPAMGTHQAVRPGTDFWVRPLGGYSRVDGKASIGQPAAHSRMQGMALGLERDNGDFYGGALLAVGHSELELGDSEARIWDTRLGLYGGWGRGGFRLDGLADAGWQNYRTEREIPLYTRTADLESRFDGFTAGLGLEASYNLLDGVSNTTALSPYAGFDLEYIWQERRTESGHDAFALNVQDKGICRSSAGLGVGVETAPADWLILSASAGYKRLLSGQRPEMRVSFKGDPSNSFKAVASDEGRDFLTYRLRAEALLGENLSLAASFAGENAHRSESYSGFVHLLFTW